MDKPYRRLLMFGAGLPECHCEACVNNYPSFFFMESPVPIPERINIYITECFDSRRAALENAPIIADYLTQIERFMPCRGVIAQQAYWKCLRAIYDKENREFDGNKEIRTKNDDCKLT